MSNMLSIQSLIAGMNDEITAVKEGHANGFYKIANLSSHFTISGPYVLNELAPSHRSDIVSS